MAQRDRESYRDFIIGLRNKWVGNVVSYKGQQYLVVDIEYNGGLLINRPCYFCPTYTAPTTSVQEWMLD